jgi:hypothetical protein
MGGKEKEMKEKERKGKDRREDRKTDHRLHDFSTFLYIPTPLLGFYSIALLRVR